ncbi:DUF3486 family protein [Labrenzia sp. PHM005]|uniref:DUF3486 family protein n=1 Tax=Labrenzia sp. PHM005 TaxID=2590016 RepID=UPI00114090C6|nr:DUF3486 family protein [Labrenzia sp. PHM005]QDG74441.1 DUF3486 family protein [Labrenzia sp. PHM005]
MRRRGRGRLSSIELLPDDADPIVAWAAQELNARSLPQIDILAEFNKRLAALADDSGQNIKPISSSAFNRYSIRQAGMTRRLQQTTEIAKVLTERRLPGETDNLTIAITETIKTLVFELLEAGGEAGLSMKAAKEAAEAVRAAVAAEKMSSDRRQKVEAEFAKKAATAVNQVAKVKGLTAETADAIKAQILGVQK